LQQKSSLGKSKKEKIDKGISSTPLLFWRGAIVLIVLGPLTAFCLESEELFSNEHPAMNVGKF